MVRNTVHLRIKGNALDAGNIVDGLSMSNQEKPHRSAMSEESNDLDILLRQWTIYGGKESRQIYFQALAVG